MSTVTIPKNEYQKLRRQADAYRRLTAQVFEKVIGDPVGEVVDDFRKTDLYSKDFLSDLFSGLRKSSYVRRHGNKTTQKRS